MHRPLAIAFCLILVLSLGATGAPSDVPRAGRPIQNPQQPQHAAFSLTQLLEQLTATERTYLAFLERSSLSCGVYRLAAGATDRQSPHARDEIYYVVSGKARFEVGGQQHDASEGAVLFVAAGAPHRFVDIEADLVALVFFSESRPTTGGMAAGPRPTEQTPYHESSERGNTRVFYWYQDGSAGQVSIDYGRPAWSPRYNAFMRPTEKVRRWRFGENFWTSLDTNIPLTIGGVDVPIGQHYLVLESHPEHDLRLVLLDPAAVRKRRLDAYEAQETLEFGTPIPLTKRASKAVAKRLTLDLQVDRSAAHKANLTVRFGVHRLTVPVTMHVE